MSTFQNIIKFGAILLAVFIIFIIFNVFLGISSILFGVTSKEELQTFSENYTNIDSLDIDISMSNLEIKKGDNFKVEATDVNKNFTIKQNGSSLKIVQKGNWFKSHIAGNIVVYVPSELLELEIDAGAGKVDIANVKAQKLDIDTGAGILNISHSEFSKTKIDGGAGEINITSSTLSNLDLESGVGKVSIQGNILGTSKIECGVGEVNVDLSGAIEDYNIRLEKGIGSIYINNKECKNKETIGNGINRIEIEGGIGQINLKTK